MSKPIEKIEVFEIQAASGMVYRVGMREAMIGAWVSVSKAVQGSIGIQIRPIAWIENADQLHGIIEQIENR